MTHYGFLGLGIMGKAMATNLLKAGLKVTVWNRTAEKCAPVVALGAAHAKSPADVVGAADITFAMVSDPAASEAICFDSGGVLEAIGANKGYIDVSTVDPGLPARIGKAISERGGRFLEAPVSGSKKPAEDGNLVFLCGGDKSLFDESQTALDIMGKKAFFFGSAGQGARMKLVINMIMGTMMAAFSEGLALGTKAGLNGTDILEVLCQGAIDNPMFRLKGGSMTKDLFTTAFPLKHMQKDLRLALQMGEENTQPLQSAAAANSSYLRAISAGFGDEDFSAVLKAIRT